MVWRRLQEKHGAADLNTLCDWLSRSEFFPEPRLRFVREGLAAWLAGDMLKAVHVLVPHVEAALRDVLAALGGAVTRPNSIGGGFHVLLLGDVLNHERFRTHIPEDTRFHFKVLYQDPLGLNVRNELAHGIAAFELFGLGLANLVVHSIILIGTFCVEKERRTGMIESVSHGPVWHAEKRIRRYLLKPLWIGVWQEWLYLMRWTPSAAGSTAPVCQADSRLCS